MPYQLFHSYQFTEIERQQMDLEGHLAYPGLLTQEAQENLTEALATNPIGLPPNITRIWRA